MPIRPVISWFRSPIVAIGLILLISLTVRIVAAIYWQNRLPAAQAFAWGDSQTYWDIATGLVKEGSYEFGTPPQRIFRAPGYCLFLASLMLVSESLFATPLSVIAARVAGCLLGSLSICFLMFWTKALLEHDSAQHNPDPSLAAADNSLAKRNRHMRVMYFVGAIASIYPGAIAMSIFILSESFFMPLMILALWASQNAFSRPTWQKQMGWALLAGMLHGDAILVRPSWLLFVPFATVYLFIFHINRVRTLAIGCFLLLGMILAMCPWWYRNYQLTDRWVPTTLQVGASLYDGWNPQADGSSDMTYGYRETERWLREKRLQNERTLFQESVGERKATAPASGDDFPVEEMLHTEITREIQANDHLQQSAKAWASANPWSVLRLFFVKVWRMWRPWPTANEVASTWLTGITVIGFALIVIPAIPVLLQKLRADSSWAFVFLPSLYFTILHGVFIGSIRYRQPAVFVLIIFAALGWLYLFERWTLAKSEKANTKL